MRKIEVYTRSRCGYCDRAKALLKSKGYEFVEINLDGKPNEVDELRQRSGMMSLPQIFIDGELVGGYSELTQWDRQGKL